MIVIDLGLLEIATSRFFRATMRSRHLPPLLTSSGSSGEFVDALHGSFITVCIGQHE